MVYFLVGIIDKDLLYLNIIITLACDNKPGKLMASLPDISRVPLSVLVVCVVVKELHPQDVSQGSRL